VTTPAVDLQRLLHAAALGCCREYLISTSMVDLADTMDYTPTNQRKERLVPIVSDTGLRHLLEVDGARCGDVAPARGGWGFADVIEEPSLALVKKHIGQPRWQELELRPYLPLARPVADWIAAAWKRDVQAKNVIVTTVDLQLNAIRRREFRNAVLTATTIPPLGGSDGLDFLTLRLAPEAARTTSASGTVAASPTPPTPRTLFPRLQLPGLDCTKVTSIEAFTVRQPFGNASSDPGVGLKPGPLSFPNLTVTLLESSASDWRRWFENFVLKGYNDDAREKTGTLTLLDERSQEELARIGLFNVGIFQLQGPVELSELLGRPVQGDSPRYVVAGLYCERMEFTLL
jgi:hypothetical protein